jgi:hypothetical protein
VPGEGLKRIIRAEGVLGDSKLLKTPFELSRWRGGRYACDTLGIVGHRYVLKSTFAPAC